MIVKLLILGAGGHGCVVRETAEAMGCFDEIAFLDDKNQNAIGKLDQYESFRDRFDSAFVAIGANQTRSLWQRQLESVGYNISTLIHPLAYLSPSADIGAGTIVEPMACINTGVTVGCGCIISISVVIDHNCQIGSFTHIDCGVILPPQSQVGKYRKLQSNNLYQSNTLSRIS